MTYLKKLIDNHIYIQEKSSTSLLFIAVLVLFSIQSCTQNAFEKKKIVYVNSYHRGHPSSDEIMDGIIDSFPADSFELQSYIMDTKRNPSQESIENIAAKLFDSILFINPDILIVSDDNAVKYLVEPYFQESNIPIVFCGINWSAQEYNLPENKITGMLEILPLADLLLSMRSYYPSMENLLVLNENTTTSRKEKLLLDTLFYNAGVKASYELVNNFEQWKLIFKDGNQLYDIIYISTNGAIKGWNQDEAVDFVCKNIKVPVVTCEDFMMPYAVFGLTKVAREQGIWAAGIAKEILQGGSPADFPLTRNILSAAWLNTSLSEKIGFKPDSILLNNSRIVKN
ncbi:MAG: hypothetical protein KAS71_00270 [Bacteroidales bacterium]|nr:hypothetical protein [Bacteroidales bacterium]